MKVLIFGGSGMLGHKLVQRWKNEFDVLTTIRGDLKSVSRTNIFDADNTIANINVENYKQTAEIINRLTPDVIVNAVGIIKQNTEVSDIIKTLTINSVFPHQLAKEAKKIGSRLICISTDCVFNGKKGNYNEDDAPDAYDLYGKSKYLGEVVTENCLTIRTSIVGRELKTDHSLVEWFLANEGNKVKGYKKAVFSGFPTIILADILADLIVNHENLNGLYHLSSEPINKYDLLELLKSAYRANIEIEALDEVKIDRSLDSTKLRNATGFAPFSWDEMIKIMAQDPTPYDEWRK